MKRRLDIYVPSEMVGIADQKPTHFLANVRAAFQGVGAEVSFMDATPEALQQSYRDDAYSLFYRNRPTHPHALEVRPAAFGPFWMIDKTADPAQKLVYGRAFEPDNVDSELATRFSQRITDRHKKAEVSQGGYVLVAMQGVIGRQRFWQSMNPLDMVRETIAHEPTRKVFLKLHPREDYSDVDLAALNAMIDGDRVQIVDGDLDSLLAGCDYTVSMNSSVSLKGLLYHKPGILFGDAEFHHVFQSVRIKGLSASFSDVMGADLPVERYLFWYLRQQHLWNFKPSIQKDILRRCRVMGWDV